MHLTDTLALDGVRITRDGYLVADVKASRTGIQTYMGAEVGKPDMAQVRVYRPESEVFSTDALASFTSIPVTVDHPPETVTSDNWRKYAVGNTGEEVARDGQSMRIPLIVKDAAAIKSVQDGKRELSCGYTCDLDWTAGITKDGLEYDAVQRNLRGNHLAIVSVARGGHDLRIGDEMPDAKLTTIVRDGVPVEVNDSAKIIIDALDVKLADANKQVGTLTASVSTKDGEIAALRQQIADAAMTPAKLDAAVAARATLIDAAKRVFPAIVADGKTDAAIRKEAVTHKLGDAAAPLDDNAIIGAFTALAASVTSDASPTADALRGIVPKPDAVKVVTDARAEMIAHLKNPTAKAA